MIFVHVGQAGVKIGENLWELIVRENELGNDGKIAPNRTIGVERDPDPFLSEVSEEYRFVPRSVFVDLDSDSIDTIRNGEYGELFNPDFFICGHESGENIYARGNRGVGKDVFRRTFNKIRKLAEDCDRLRGIVITHSLGGGTGSGLACRLLEEMSLDYGRKSKVDFVVYPSPNILTSVTEPYNAVLSTYSLLYHTDLTVMFDNEAMLKVCMNKCGIETPSFVHCNQLISQTISSMFSSDRSISDLSMNLDEQLTNVVCYPRFHFCLSSLSPFIDTYDRVTSSFSSQNNEVDSQVCEVDKMTQDVFDNSSFLVSVDLEKSQSRFISSCLMYRGDVDHSSVIKSLNTSIRKQRMKNLNKKKKKRKKKRKHEKERKLEVIGDGDNIINNSIANNIIFNEFSSGGVKFGICKSCYEGPSYYYSSEWDSFPLSITTPKKNKEINNYTWNEVKRDVSMIASTTSLEQPFSMISKKFDKVFKKRSFVSWYLSEGMEDYEFTEKREDINYLVNDFHKVSGHNEDEEEDEDE